MSDRLNPTERESRKLEIIELTGTGVALTDLALTNLEFRANPQTLRMNRRKLNLLTQVDASILSGIESRFSKMSTNLSFIESLTLPQLQTDMRYLADFFINPLKRELKQKISAMTPESFKKLKAE